MPRLDEKILKMVHEAPKVMLIPVTILAILSIIGGFIGFSFGQKPFLERFLAKADVTLAEEEPHGLLAFFTPEMLLAVIGALLAVFSAYIIYTRYADRIGDTFATLRKSFYIDEIYNELFVRPLEALSRFIAYVVEPKFFEGSIRAVGQSVQRVSHWMQQMQSGQIRSYIAWMVIGMVLLLAYLVL
jgi:NADH-quinone oxidoreductase subunit L